MSESDAHAATRLDRWLFASRAFKSRSLAAQACDGGKVTVNGTTAKPHKAVRAGDLIEVSTPVGPRRWRVITLSDRRGPASEARTLYEDLTPPPPPRDPNMPYRERGAGRPTKRERRQWERLR